MNKDSYFIHDTRIKFCNNTDRRTRDVVQPVINGTFNAQRFFDTLALILSNRENMKITVTVVVDNNNNKTI